MDIAPEKWIQDQCFFQLQQVSQALDAAHTLPFQCEWLNQDLARTYLELLKEMEAIQLKVWTLLKKGNLELVEHWVLVWLGKQKRTDSNVFRKYYQIHELLVEWENESEVQKAGFNGIWEDFIVFVLYHEANFLSKSITSKSGNGSENMESFAIQYLQQMQKLYLASPHKICTDIFTLFSPFTQESVFLPLHCKHQKTQLKNQETEKFIEKFVKFENGHEVAHIYIELLKKKK